VKALQFVWLFALVALALTNRAQAQEKGGGTPGDGQKHPVMPIVAVLDANGDGVIDASEIVRAPVLLKKLDKNGDGKLTREEIMPDRPQGNGRAASGKSGPGGGGLPGGEGAVGPGGPHATAYTLSGTYMLAGQKVQTVAQTYTSGMKDISAVYVCSGGALTLIAPKITTTGNTSSEENSSFYGLNAAVLVAKGSRVTITGGWVTTSGAGANGVFATGLGAEACLTQVTINATGDGGHGAMASAGGRLILRDVTITTLGEHGAALATDRGGGTLIASGGIFSTAWQGSPGIYSTGNIVVSNATFKAMGAEGAVIEGENLIDLTDCTVSAKKLCGVMLYQSFSGDAEGSTGRFTMRGGSFSAEEGPLFYVTNAKGFITLNGVRASAASSVLVYAGADRWGVAGSNGGHAVLTAEAETLNGDLICDNISTIDATLKKGTTLTGALKGASLTLDASSKWYVTGNSVIKGLALSGGISRTTVANIIGNGREVRYDASLASNKWLKGKTYALTNGGSLLPVNR